MKTIWQARTNVLNTPINNTKYSMAKKISVMPDLLGVMGIEKEIYLFVIDNWPTTPIEIAIEQNEDVSDRNKKRRASTKYAYYVKKLVEKKLLLSKKAGNSIIVWPLLAEKYRTIHNILKHYEPEHIAAMNKQTGDEHA